MNRLNVGNVVTNGMQILSVGATTASKMLARADKTLINTEISEQQQAIQQKQQADIDWQAKYKQDIASIQDALQPVYQNFKAKKENKEEVENANV